MGGIQYLICPIVNYAKESDCDQMHKIYFDVIESSMSGSSAVPCRSVPLCDMPLNSTISPQAVSVHRESEASVQQDNIVVCNTWDVPDQRKRELTVL